MLLALPDTRATWLIYAAFLALVALLFFFDLSGLPLDTHDEDYFRDSADALENPTAFFAPDKRMPGRPALELVLLLQYLAWGENPAAYHLCGGLLHLVAALVLARAGRALGLELALALLTGLLFLINVSHFNAVHWISAQCYALVLICGCLAQCAYLLNRPLLVYALLLVAMLFHIAAAAFLPFFFYLAWRRGDPSAFRRYLPLGILLATLALGLKLGYPQAPQTSVVAAGFAPWGVLRNLLICWSRLFSTAHWLPHPLHLFAVWEWVTGAVALLACVAFQWRYRFPLSEWQAWILVHLLPPLLLAPAYIQTIPSGPSRYLYLSSAGIAGLLAWTLRQLAARVPMLSRPILTLLVILVSWTSYIGLEKATAITHYAAGRHYLADHQLDQGILELSRAIAIAPETIDLEDAYVRLVPMLYNRGDQRADSTLAAALGRFPQNHTLRLMRLALDSLGPIAGAEPARRQLDSFKRSRGVARLIAEIYYHLGRGRQNQDDRAEALSAFRRSLEFEPQRAQTQQGLSAALALPANP
ncbi:MAG: hypothetical protein VX293_07590 [Candidatus Latescibacterota bacterium]|nr:hypothetical protein [Candidatus Latescibacterota bacterium]